MTYANGTQRISDDAGAALAVFGDNGTVSAAVTGAAGLGLRAVAAACAANAAAVMGGDMSSVDRAAFTVFDATDSGVDSFLPPLRTPETAAFLSLLQEQTERMAQMTKILLEMSELRTVPCDDRVELAPMIEEIFTDLAPLAERRHIALEADGGAVLTGSDPLLYRLLFNLTENAIRYGRPDGAVRIAVSEADGNVQIRVRDHGPGIPEAYRESVFQPFFRVDKSRSRAHGGVGLGLSLVWEIAALHGGTVQIERSGADGTVMLVTLPRDGKEP